MSLLQAVENYLGDVGGIWPSKIIIITYLLAEKLTTFFAGNGVPKILAYKLYCACNDKATAELVRQLFYTRFSLWHSSDIVRHHSVYYDVRIKQHVRLHVPYFTELLAIKCRVAAGKSEATVKTFC